MNTNQQIRIFEIVKDTVENKTPIDSTELASLLEITPDVVEPYEYCIGYGRPDIAIFMSEHDKDPNANVKFAFLASFTVSMYPGRDGCVVLKNWLERGLVDPWAVVDTSSMICGSKTDNLLRATLKRKLGYTHYKSSLDESECDVKAALTLILAHMVQNHQGRQVTNLLLCPSSEKLILGYQCHEKRVEISRLLAESGIVRLSDVPCPFWRNATLKDRVAVWGPPGLYFYKTYLGNGIELYMTPQAPLERWSANRTFQHCAIVPSLKRLCKNVVLHNGVTDTARVVLPLELQQYLKEAEYEPSYCYIEIDHY
jgi:hypothetical protein